MRYHVTEPARADEAEPSLRAVERCILQALLSEGAGAIWIRDELQHEFPDAGVAFQDAIASLECANVIHTYGPFIKLSRSAIRTGELTDSFQLH